MNAKYCNDCAFADFRYNNAPVGSGHSTFLCALHNKFRNYGNVDCGEWKDRYKEGQDDTQD